MVGHPEGSVALMRSADRDASATRERMAARLVGRELELELVDSAAHGAGLLLAIEGPPGIGKTALIAEAKASGQEAGMQVLGARGSELERAFSYGVVRQLFEPLLASLPAEDASRAVCGRGGFRGPALRSRAAGGRAGRRFTVGDAARPLLADGQRRFPRAAAPRGR